MTTPSTLVIAQEAIDFQDGRFFKAITELIQNTNCESKTSIHKFEQDLSTLAKKTLGIKLSVADAEGDSFAINIPSLSMNNPLWAGWYRSYFELGDEVKTLQKLMGKKGFVDLEHSKVSGFFEEFELTLYVDYKLIAEKVLEPSEAAAAILHEFGHFFTACELLDRTATNNLVLATVAQVMQHGTEVKKREMVLEMAGKKLAMSESVIADLKASTSDTAVSTILVAEFADRYRSQMGNGYYDITTMEFLADQFATRHGAARDLVTGLDKIYKYYGVNLSRSHFLKVVIDILDITGNAFLIGLGIVGVAVTVGGASILSFIAMVYGALNLITLGADYLALHNDHPERVMRIRSDLVQALKSPYVTKEFGEQVARNIKVIDELLSTYAQHRGFMQRLFDFFSTVRRDNQASMRFQRELEQLAMNDLFIKAFELQHV